MTVEDRKQPDMILAVRTALTEMAEPEYRSFTLGLLPGVDNLLGVRLPKLRKYAGQVLKTYGLSYLDETLDENSPNHGDVEYLEEILLQGMLIGKLKVRREDSSRKRVADVSLEQIQAYIRSYLPKVDNWSACDSFCAGLKITKEYPEQMWEFLKKYLKSERCFDVRFAVVMILNYYIKEERLEELFEIFGEIGKAWQKPEDNYYVEMALAWAISICYVSFPDRTLSYLEEMRTKEDILDFFTYNKALQKIVESNCVTPETKAKIKLLKRTKKA